MNKQKITISSCKKSKDEMTYVVVILIGILVFGFLLGTALELIEKLCEFLAKLIEALKKISIIRIIGRRSIGAQLKFDLRLTSDEFELKRAAQIELLKKYEPGIGYKDNFIYLQYVSDIEELEMVRNNKVTSITIEKIKSAIKPNINSAINKAESMLDRSNQFPAHKPKFNSKLLSLPIVELDSKFDIDIPSIKLPLYSKFTFLNKFIYSEFKKEINLINDYAKKRNQLLFIYKKQELELKNALFKANKRYEAACIEEKNNYQNELNKWYSNQADWENYRSEEIGKLKKYIESFANNDIETQSKLILNTIELLEWHPKNFEVKYDANTKILIVELMFIDIGSISFLKEVQLKSGKTLKALNQKEHKEAISYIYPTLALRILYELAVQIDGDVEAIAINGWTDYVVKATGNTKRAYCCSLISKIDEIRNLKLNTLDSLTAFDNLKGVVARSFEVTPIAPLIRINATDSRFIDEKEVLGKLDSNVNLAIMDWDEFEHLCRQLFEKQFASVGAVVKVTQASRDKGVDAIVFDPDPVRGGKIVIQAKRYVNTVDVSAVRDLYGTVMNEGAMKGILVTTSQYGPEAYSFIQNKPLTLINGNELLSLLEINGYNFRINLEEARKYLKENNSFPFKRYQPS